MLKLVGILVIFLGSTFLGYSYGERYNFRSKQLNCINKALILLNNEILYGNKPLPTALKDVGSKIEEPLSNIFDFIAEELIVGITPNVYSAFLNAYKEYEDKVYLADDDLNILKDFFKSLGETGAYGQEKIFNLSMENIKTNCILADELSSKNVKMWRAIGVTAGAMISLLLI